MIRPLVYLSGPVGGLSYDSARSWREVVASRLGDIGIGVLDPCRWKHHLRHVPVMDDREPGYQDKRNSHTLTTDDGITSRDRFDVKRCDMMLLNLLGATDKTLGSMIEVGWADAWGKPIVLVIEPEGNLHDHPMVRSICGHRVPSLLDGVEVCRAYLSPLTTGPDQCPFRA